MGKSAKLHKRFKKSKSSASTGTNPASSSASSSRTQVQAAKKHSALKEKAGKGKGLGSSEKGVLGGADYLTLLTGSRKRIAEEATKLPQN